MTRRDDHAPRGACCTGGGVLEPSAGEEDAMTARLEYRREELLADVAVEKPLVPLGVRCHGGFVGGEYVSPRSVHRGPAIAAWQQRLRDDGHPLVHLPTQYVPPHYPNYAQAKLLLQEGLAAPITRSLTIISIVEGFGA